MKSFLELIEEKEATKKPVVMAFGRMNPPTTGHMKLIDKVKSHAEKLGAKHTVVVSHSQDTKKNPLSSEQKIKHLKRYAPGVHFEASSKEHPTILHHAARLHAQGHDHLVVVGGSDRVKEYHDLLHNYNGVKGKHGHYNFKKISVVSAGHRDPDSEGAEGMSATKMREHAKNKDFHSFRQGVPSHVSDTHAKELMNDVRKGMGINEQWNRGQFKAIFITGGPGSGKDVVVREAIPESKFVEFNTVQAYQYLADKQKLSEKSSDIRRESIRNRGPIIINGPADDFDKFSYIKEELEDLGYETFMVFVNTTNEASQERNTKLSRMMVESIRQDKWLKAQENLNKFIESYDEIIFFDNTESLEITEEYITKTYQTLNKFIDKKSINEASFDWLENQGRLNINDKFDYIFKEQKNVEKANKFLSFRKTGAPRAASPADPSPDNRKLGTELDDLRGNTRPRKDPNGRGHSGGAWSGVYSTEAKAPSLTKRPEKKESNFSFDKDKLKKMKRGDRSIGYQRLGKPSGIGPEYDTRAGGQGAAAGAGLGDQTFREDVTSNDDVISFGAIAGGPKPNPLQSQYQPENKKKKKTFKEFYGFQNDTEMGVAGVLGGATNKEPMQSYKDQERNIGVMIKKKKKKQEK